MLELHNLVSSLLFIGLFRLKISAKIFHILVRRSSFFLISALPHTLFAYGSVLLLNGVMTFFIGQFDAADQPFSIGERSGNPPLGTSRKPSHLFCTLKQIFSTQPHSFRPTLFTFSSLQHACHFPIVAFP